MPGADRDILAFRSERARHEQFLGREDVLAAIDGCLSGPGAARGWVLVTGQPGMGKSAILTRWLTRAERAGRAAPHHFLRRGVADWDRPEAIARSLTAQIERIYPAQADPEAAPERRFLDLLGRVSREVLAPQGERLVLVADGLNEAAAEPGRRIVSASHDHTLKVWDLESRRQFATLQRHARRVSGCAATPDGRHIVSASEDHTLKVWHVETGQLLATLQGHADSVEACAVTPDGRRIVSASWDETLRVWDLETGRPLATLQGHTRRVTGCAVTLDGDRIVSASYDRTLKVWHLGTGQPLATLQGHSDRVMGCAVTPDGRIISASDDHTLKIWDAETGRPVATLEGHTFGVTGCAVTPDGRRVVSASYDHTLKVWDLETGRMLATLEGHTFGVTGCAVTPDGRHVVSASYDNTLKIWDLSTGLCLATLYGLGRFQSIAAAPNLLCAGDDAGNLWILEPPTPSLPMPTPALKLFYSYAHADETLRKELETHLAILKHQGLLESWNDRDIDAGDEWERAIDENLETADVILLLVSASFIASKYCFTKELTRAMERHEAKEARVIPVFLRPCDWSGTLFGKIQGLPRDAKPVTKWADRDEAWTDVAKGVRRALEGIRAQRTASPTDPGLRPAPPAAAPTGVPASPAPALAGGTPTLPTLRKLLGEVLRGADLDAFCLDYFSATHKRFGGAMGSVEKTNLLLQHEDPSAILDALREYAPGAVTKHEGLLRFA